MPVEARLFTPGPLCLSSYVKTGMLFDLGSRDAEFKTITREIRERILTLAHAENSHSAIPIQGSGTFAVEAALTTFIGAHEKALVCINGAYGERIAKILKTHGRAFTTHRTSSTQVPDVSEIEQLLARNPDITHLCFVHCETTTGILNPFSELIAAARRHGVKTIIDSMSAFGGLPISAQDDKFDILISSGNKCLEAPPGIAFAIVSRELLTKETTYSTSYCLNLYDQWLSFETLGEWRTTPPTHVAQALHRALSEQANEGTQNRYRRYCSVRDRLIAGLAPMGIRPILEKSVQSPICVAFDAGRWITNQSDFEQLYNYLSAERLYIYAKLNTDTRTFRIGCIGQIKDQWLEHLINRIRRYLDGEGRCTRSDEAFDPHVAGPAYV